MNEIRAINIENNALQELNEHELKSVSGGIGLLLPAIQKVELTHDVDGTSNTILFAERYAR